MTIGSLLHDFAWLQNGLASIYYGGWSDIHHLDGF